MPVSECIHYWNPVAIKRIAYISFYSYEPAGSSETLGTYTYAQTKMKYVWNIQPNIVLFGVFLVSVSYFIIISFDWKCRHQFYTTSGTGHTTNLD